MTPTFSRVLMTASALFLFVLGLCCVFAPDVLLNHFAGGTSPAANVMVQLTGALYVGFGLMNWMSKGSLMGGIYGRPVAVGNLLHFFAGAMALLKAAPPASSLAFAWPLALVYVAFAVGFGLVVLRNPLPPKQDGA